MTQERQKIDAAGPFKPVLTYNADQSVRVIRVELGIVKEKHADALAELIMANINRRLGEGNARVMMHFDAQSGAGITVTSRPGYYIGDLMDAINESFGMIDQAMHARGRKPGVLRTINDIKDAVENGGVPLPAVEIIEASCRPYRPAEKKLEKAIYQAIYPVFKAREPEDTPNLHEARQLSERLARSIRRKYPDRPEADAEQQNLPGDPLFDYIAKRLDAPPPGEPLYSDPLRKHLTRAVFDAVQPLYAAQQQR